MTNNQTFRAAMTPECNKNKRETLMRKTKIAKVLIPLMLGSLTACGGGSNDPDPQDVPVTPATTSADISGSAVKGALSNANLAMTPANSTVDLTTTTSTDDGSFPAMVITSQQGFGLDDMFQISVSPSTNSMMVCDAVACGNAVTGDLLTADDIAGLTLTSVKWVSAIYGTSSDGVMEATFQANMLTTLAHRLLNIAIAEEGARVSSEDLLTSAQINATDRLFKLLGIKTKGENIFTMHLASAESSANFDGLSDLATQLSFVNAAFSSYTDSSTLAETITNAATWMESAFRDDNLDDAIALRQFILDALAGHAVATELGIDLTAFVNLKLPLAEETFADTRPIVQFTTADIAEQLEITFRAQINEDEGATKAFDGTIDTKWLDHSDWSGVAPSVETPAWIQIKYPEPVAASAIAITNANWADSRERDVENFNLQASNDGENWVKLTEVEGVTYEAHLTRKQFPFVNGIAYSYYRVNITKNFGDQGLTSLSEIEFAGLPVADVNHALKEGKTVTRRAEINEDEGAEKAFDGNIDTKWLDHSDWSGVAPSAEEPAWIQADFDAPVAVNSIALTNGNWADSRERDVENVNLQASHDGEYWFDLNTVEGIVYSKHQERKMFGFGNGLAFSSYRLNITKNFGDQGLTSMAELELIGPDIADVNHSLDPAKTIDRRAEINEDEGAAKAFDGDINTKWLDHNDWTGVAPSIEDPAWIQTQFEQARVVNTIAITTGNWADSRERDVENFNLQASNDGENWVTLAEVEGVVFEAHQTRQYWPFANSLAFNYYRLNVTKNFGDQGLTSMMEVELIGPTEATQINHGPTATVTGFRAQINDDEAAIKAFDGDINTKWLDHSDWTGVAPSVDEPSWITVELPQDKVINMIAITNGNWADSRERDPENFYLQGSVDGENWITLTDVEGMVFGAHAERQQFSFVNGRALKHYRLNITKNFGNQGLTSMMEVELIGPEN